MIRRLLALAALVGVLVGGVLRLLGAPARTAPGRGRSRAPGRRSRRGARRRREGPRTRGPARAAASPFGYVVHAFALSKKRIVHGKAVFRVVNTGEVIHDFKIAGKKTPIFTKGQSGFLRVAFKKPGRYLFVCTVLGHIAAGMKGTLIVR